MAKQPVMLLHSGGMSSRQWKKLAEALAPSHTVIAPDMIGSGDNPLWPLDEPFHFTKDVDAIEKRITELGEPVHLVGHSYGGFVATQLVTRIPASIASITAYDPVAFGVLYDTKDEAGLEDLDRVSKDPIFADEANGGNEVWFEAFVDYWNVPGAWKAMPQAGRDSFLRIGRKVFWEVRSLMTDRTPASAFANVKADALFITGDKSPAAARCVVAILAEAFPNGHADTVAGAGHMGPLTNGPVVNELIVNHVRSFSS